MNLDVTIEGLEDVEAFLREAPRTIVASGFLRAGRDVAAVMENELALRTPVDEGDLFAALASEVELDADFRGVSINTGFGKRSHIARFVEYGHRQVGRKWKYKFRKRDKRGYVMGDRGRWIRLRERQREVELGTVKPHPFMQPAAAAAFEPSEEAFAESIQQTMRENFDGN